MPDIITGPRGGKYYIKNGRKIYIGSTGSLRKKSKGCSNVGKYKGVPEKFFCGPEGGSCPGSYPVNTAVRARAALAYSRHAPNPQGIRNCVYRISEQQGWLNPETGKLTMRGKTYSKSQSEKKKVIAKNKTVSKKKLAPKKMVKSKK